MCGRFTLTKRLQDIIKRFEIDELTFTEKEYEKSYNISPGRNVLIVYQIDNKNILDLYYWGFVPHWAKDISNYKKIINTRMETIAQKPSFKYAFLNNRCLILADGYFEWLKQENKKIPFYFYIGNHELFAFAGIKSVWQKGDYLFKGCSIVTTSPNDEKIKEIHNRMPVILTPENEEVWVNTKITSKDLLIKTLKINLNKNLTYHRVSTSVNNPRNDFPENIHIIKDGY